MLKFISYASKYLVKGMSSNVNIKGFYAGALSLLFIHLLQTEAKGLLFLFIFTVPLQGSMESRVIINKGFIPPWAHIKGISKVRPFRGHTDVINR
jgi:hypothetical protein